MNYEKMKIAFIGYLSSFFDTEQNPAIRRLESLPEVQINGIMLYIMRD
jgi:hypothetical protein